jgi:hypothetical protein|nr:hypothetical protein [Neorhizobium tomejilense]
MKEDPKDIGHTLPGIDAIGTFLHLVWAGMPLLAAFGTRENPHLVIASSQERGPITLYFAIPFDRRRMDDFVAGRIRSVEDAIAKAGGNVLYTEDFITFVPRSVADMPEDDKVILGNTWTDFEAMFTEETPSFLLPE